MDISTWMILAFVTVGILCRVSKRFNKWVEDKCLHPVWRKAAPIREWRKRLDGRLCKRRGHKPDCDEAYLLVRYMHEKGIQDDTLRLHCKRCGEKLEEYYIHTKQRRK